MMQRLVILAALLALFAPARAQEIVRTNAEQATELWEGKALGATFRFGICHKPGGYAQGVLVLRHRSGSEDVYHLYGTLRNNEFFLTHSSGHKFSGKLAGPASMEGKARLSSGIKLTLSGKRTLDAPLAAPDCAPLPE